MDGDIEDFLERVSTVEAELARLTSGGAVPTGLPAPLRPDVVHEESAASRRARAAAERVAEVRKWWRNAAILQGFVDGDAEATREGASPTKSPTVAAAAPSSHGGGGGGGIDYSKWDKWAVDPDDPVTREEDKVRHHQAVHRPRAIT